MRITVLGGSGFIGRHLVDALLASGHAVRVFARRPTPHPAASVVAGDIADAAAVSAALAGCDCVIDLVAAAHEHQPPAHPFVDEALAGVGNVIAAAEHHGIERLLFCSSVSVYGPAQPDVGEAAPLQPRTAYALSKCASEAAYREWRNADAERRSLTLLRPSVLYGEGDRGNVQRLLEQLRRRRLVMIGDGRNRKSIAYVGNFVAFVQHCLALPPGEHCYNYADPPAPSVRELIDTLVALLPDARPPRWRVPLPLAHAGARVIDVGNRLLGRRRPGLAARVRSFVADTRVDASAVDASGFVRPHAPRDALARTVAVVRRDD